MEAESNICAGDRVDEVSASTRMGWFAGLNLRAWGGLRSADGRSVIDAWIAACTSRSAPSMLRLMSNCRTIWVLPVRELDVISVTEAMAPR